MIIKYKHNGWNYIEDAQDVKVNRFTTAWFIREAMESYEKQKGKLPDRKDLHNQYLVAVNRKFRMECAKCVQDIGVFDEEGSFLLDSEYFEKIGDISEIGDLEAMHDRIIMMVFNSGEGKRVIIFPEEESYLLNDKGETIEKL